MIIEHFLYNIAIAILVGIFYNKYFKRNPTWIIVFCAGLPDIDYILQSFCFLIYDNTGYILPIMINHGNFHSFVVIVVLAVVFGYIIHKYFGENIYDSMILVFIGSLAHFICDLIVYTYTYYPFYPLNGFAIKTIAVIEETRNMPLGLGDWDIFIIGICFVTYACIIKFAIEGVGSIDYLKLHVRNHAKNAYLICMAFVRDIPIKQ